ncbi:uncharacterized protein C12orf71 homolog [Trichosurus vulpecula]|uniref:uncharacterized protein C12orf71 homolog n=1 Tax=Trichosurus vulpecula TaxID=9337 RepID=UPI00186B5567|nr:uncharacterized protein C12orf71 homolog [Trichosurus vulpecula]
MRSDPLDAMTQSPSSWSDSTDTEISSSESNFSLSVGYYPSQEINCCEETGPECESIHFLPPCQGAWLTERMGKPKGRYSKVETSPEQFSKLRITLAWDIDLGPDQLCSVSNWKLNKENNWAGMKQERNTHQTMRELDGFVQKLEADTQKEDTFIPGSLLKDSQITTVSPLETTKTTTTSIQYETTSQASPTVPLAENRHLVQPVMPQECQLKATKQLQTWQYRKETPSYKRIISSGESSSLFTEKREYQTPPSPGRQSLSCLNIGRIVRWLREQVISSLSGKEQSQNKSPEGTKLLAQKRQCSCRERRVQPQDAQKSTCL